MEDTSKRTVLSVRELDCAAEEQLIRKRLRSVAGVRELGFNVVAREVTLDHDPGVDEQAIEAIRGLGMTVQRKAANGQVAAAVAGTADCGGVACADPEPTGFMRRENVMLAASGVLAVASEIISWTTGHDRGWPVVVTAVAAILLGGLPTLKKGLVALRNFTLNINLLMAIAVIGAFAIGEFPEAAMVVFLFAIAELIERYALDRARNAVRTLMELAPDSASVRGEGGGWTDVPAGDVQVGTVVRVRAGERVPLDGIVESGTSVVDQAPITGESVPVEKVKGDQLFAGTINGNGLLEFKTTGGKDDSTIARIIRSVQEAQADRAPTQRFVDSFAQVYTPIVVVLALLVALTPWLIFSQPFMPWLYKALVLLVIACPCALVISTPVTVVSALAAAAKRGVLIKGGAYLEEGRKLTVVALDKTGTITEGRPKLTDVVPLGQRTRDEVLQLAASVDAGSDHPVARAVVGGWAGELLPAEAHEAITGRGVQARIQGQTFVVGNHRLAEERGVCSKDVERELGILESQGKTAIVVANEREVIGVLGVADTPRATSVEAIEDLHRLGIRVLMLTGDNQQTADAIAKTVQIDEARGSLLPEDKLKAIEDLLGRYRGVGMVGDGINDAPALAKATIGFAMGAAGTDTAIETADVALMQDDLRALPFFIRLSRKTATVLKQNIGFSIAAKVVFFLLAVFGYATLWMAVLADVGASLVVIVNGLRLLRSSRTLK